MKRGWSWLGLLLLTLAVMAGAGTVEASQSTERAPIRYVTGAHGHGAHASVGHGEPTRLPATEPSAVEAEKDDEDPDGFSGKIAVAMASAWVSFDGVRARSSRLATAPGTGRRSASTGLARGPPVAR